MSGATQCISAAYTHPAGYCLADMGQSQPQTPTYSSAAGTCELNVPHVASSAMLSEFDYCQLHVASIVYLQPSVSSMYLRS